MKDKQEGKVKAGPKRNGILNERETCDTFDVDDDEYD